MHRLCLSRALERPRGFKAQELANVIWALATCGTGICSQRAQEVASYCVQERLRRYRSSLRCYVLYILYIYVLDI